MNVIERRKAVKEYKARHGCAKCGKIGKVREALLIRPDRTGICLSRLLSMSSLSDEALWEEISRRVVVCKRCFWGRRGGRVYRTEREFFERDIVGSFAASPKLQNPNVHKTFQLTNRRRPWKLKEFRVGGVGRATGKTP